MAQNNSVKVNSRKGVSSRPMSSDHVTTLDFNVVKPIGIYELVPGDTIHIQPEVWMRTQALACPTFGKVDVIQRAFFVPHRLTFRRFLDFWRQQDSRGASNTYASVPSECLNYNMRDLSMRFERRFKVVSVQSDYETHKVEPELMDGYPFRFTLGLEFQNGSNRNTGYDDFNINVTGSILHHRFNPLGKRVYDLFVSLGYRWQFFTNNDASHDTHNNGNQDNTYSASMLPILSWLKIFQDWYCPSEFRYIFNVDAVAEREFLSQSDIDNILDMTSFACYIFYNDDIFSLAEKAPYSKQSQSSLFSQYFNQQTGATNDIVDWQKSFKVVTDSKFGAIISQFGSYAGDTNTYLTVDGNPLMGSQTGATIAKNIVTYGSNNPGMFAAGLNNVVSAWSVRAVIKAATWLQRNNLLPARANDYLRAKFGVSPSAERLNIAEYIGSASKPLQISDVVSTEASGNNLGALGGKGTAYSIDKLSYHAEEFGYFIVTCELRPHIEYGQGVDPLVLRTRVDQFYQQETDGLGFSPVPTQCLVGGPITGLEPWNLGDTYNMGAIENRIFGYLPNHWDYKCKHSNLSGDFGIPGNIDIQAFHLMRYVGGSDVTEYAQNSLSFRYPGLCFYDNEFARIFVDSSLVHLKDHFQMIASFDCNIVGEMLSLNESWQVNDEHDERNGQNIEIQSVL